MVMTIGKMTDALINYCATTRCDKCKIMGRYYTCRLSEVQAEINGMFETVNNLDTETEKAGRSANQSANSVKTPHTNDTTSDDEIARAILQVVESASTEELYKHINFILLYIRLKRQEDIAMDSMDPEWLITEFYNDGTGWYFGTTKKEEK